MVVKRHARTGIALLALVLAIAASTSTAGGLGRGNHKQSPTGAYAAPAWEPCEPPPWTVFQAGNDFDNLQIYVTGPCFNTLEIYFKRAQKAPARPPSPLPPVIYVFVFVWPNFFYPLALSPPTAASPPSPAPDRFFRDTIDGASCLYTNNSLALAPANEWGTFAVRYGPYQDKFNIYGWCSDGKLSIYRGASPVPGHPVCLRWITSRIVRVEFGAGSAQPLILRFNADATKPVDHWTDKPDPTCP
jgi:hypothetical protein